MAGASKKRSADDRRAFAAAKFKWLRRVATDAALSHLAVRVGLLLSSVSRAMFRRAA